jgi:hypothetical protein
MVFLNMKNQSKFGLLKVVCNEKQGGSRRWHTALTVAIEACLPFKFALVFNFNVFPFPPSKLEVGWPRNGYLVISRNTKWDEIKQFFRGISAEFRERILPKFRIFSRNTFVIFAEFRGISWSRSTMEQKAEQPCGGGGNAAKNDLQKCKVPVVAVTV